MKSYSHYINSILISIIICIDLIMYFIGETLKINNAYTIVIFSCFIISFINNKFRINKVYLYTVFVGIVYILISICRIELNNYAIENILFYIENAIMAGYIVSNGFKLEYISKSIIIINAIVLPLFLLTDFTSYLPGNLMSISYAILPSLMIGIIVINNKFKISKWMRVLNLFNNLIYIDFLIQMGSRGAIVSLFIFIAIYFYSNLKNIIEKSIWSIIYFVIGLWSILNLENILTEINIFLLNQQIEISFINKALRLMKNGDISNGRTHLYTVASNLLEDNIILGPGMGVFESIEGTYPHNIFYQFWLDLGFVGMVLSIVIIFIGILLCLFAKDIEKKYIITLLWCFAIPKLMFSSTFWRSSHYWMLIILVLIIISNQNIVRKKLIYSKEG